MSTDTTSPPIPVLLPLSDFSTNPDANHTLKLVGLTIINSPVAITAPLVAAVPHNTCGRVLGNATKTMPNSIEGSEIHRGTNIEGNAKL